MASDPPTPPAPGGTTPAPLDLSKAVPDKSGETGLNRTDQYSVTWAKVVGPISWAVIGLFFLVIVIPFWMIWCFSNPPPRIVLPASATTDLVATAVKTATDAGAAQQAQQVKDMLDWAKTILPSIVGFGTAIIAYYFGIRSAGTADSSSTTAGGS